MAHHGHLHHHNIARQMDNGGGPHSQSGGSSGNSLNSFSNSPSGPVAFGPAAGQGSGSSSSNTGNTGSSSSNSNSGNTGSSSSTSNSGSGTNAGSGSSSGSTSGSSSGGPNFFDAGSSDSSTQNTQPQQNVQQPVQQPSSSSGQQQQTQQSQQQQPQSQQSQQQQSQQSQQQQSQPVQNVQPVATPTGANKSSQSHHASQISAPASVNTASLPGAIVTASPTADYSSPSASISPYDQASASSAPSASQDGGISAGAKGGIAFGVIFGILAVIGIIFFVYKRKQFKKQNQQLESEKIDYNGQNAANGGLAPRVSVKRARQDDAPRLSLRAVSGMFPEMNEKQQRANTVQNGMLAPAGAGMRARSPEGPSTQHMAASPNTTDEKANPFGDHAKANGSQRNSGGSSKGADDTTAFAGPAAVAAAAVAPKPLNVAANRPTTPNGQGRPQSPALGGPQGPAGPAGPLNVHRVQLDFAPSMADELELRAGQLVRMLHEYDDGWALCKRLDGSQQGVVPRTCLSKLPVRPRPNPNGPPPPHMRGAPNGRMPPPGARPMGPPPQGGRSRSGSSSPMVGGGRNSPGPFGAGQYAANGPESGRTRSNSAAVAQQRRVTPPAVSPVSSASSSPTQSSSVPSRKPVPGQAM